MTENELSKIIVDVAFQIHYELGPGLFESVYHDIMEHEIRQAGLFIEKQKPISLKWKGLKFKRDAFKADLLVENKVIIEIKSIEKLAPVHFKRVTTYLKLADIKLGLLINFNEVLIKDGIHRIVNKL